MKKVPEAVKEGTNRALEELAPKFLEATVNNEAKFNNYIGNLEGAYVAIVVTNGVRKRIFYHDPKKRGKVIDVLDKNGRRTGGRKVKMTKQRHAVMYKRRNPDYGHGEKGYHKYERREVPYKNTYYRYLNKNENENGYKWRAKAFGTGNVGGSYSDKKGRKAGVYRSFIMVRNVAPYAAYVQYQRNHTKHYNVLRGATVDQLHGQTKELVKNAILADLKRFGFRTRKYKMVNGRKERL